MKDFSNHTNDKYLHSEITGKILQCFYLIINKIGYGFDIESYSNALAAKLDVVGLNSELNKSINLIINNKIIGEFKIDILVENKVNVMIISEERINQEHEIKLHNQLRNSNIEIGLLLNLYIEGEHKRKYFSNELKKKN